MTILYAIIFILAIHLSWPGSVLWLAAFGIVWSVLKAVLKAIIDLAQEASK